MPIFKIIPILGRKTNVNQGDITLFKVVAQDVVLTNDVGGVNFDLNRKRNACTKSFAYTKWATSAVASPTNCQGLFELYDGTNRDYIIFDHGKFFVYDTNLDPADKTAAGITHHATNLFSMLRVGNHIVFCDGVAASSNTPYAWKHGDATAAKLVNAETEYKFKYLEYFSNRIIGAYSDQTNGDIDLRWTGVLPAPTTSCSFVAANQMYIPNDDTITGISRLGLDRCYVYSEDSIHQLIFYNDYSTPFRCYTVIPKQGAVNQHSIVNTGNAHYFFNKNYGFTKYTGTGDLVPISDDIESDIQNINPVYYDKIVGTFVPLKNMIAWAVPAWGSSTNNYIFYYDLKTNQWTVEDTAVRFISSWTTWPNYTWQDLIDEMGGDPVWTDFGTSSWAYYIAYRQRLMGAGTDGWARMFSAETIDGSTALNSYRIEPIMDFGDRNRRDLLKEIWVQISEYGVFDLTFWHRSGNTVAEIQSEAWTSIGTISCNLPVYPVLYINKPAKLHQIKWGTTTATSKYQVVEIDFHYEMEGKY